MVKATRKRKENDTTKKRFTFRENDSQEKRKM